MASLDAVAKVLPVLLLFGLGAILRRGTLLRPTTIDDLRRLVLDIALPSALFLAFIRTTMDVGYALIVVCVFVALVVVFAAALAVARAAGVRPAVAPGLLVGFESGMLGLAIYGAIYGADELYRYAIVDLGQEPFLYFILATWLARRGLDTPPSLRATAIGFVRTPVIVAIAAGVVGSILGLGQALEASPIGAAILQTIGLVGALTTPLIAIVIGYSTRLGRGALGAPLATVAVRLAIWVPLGLAFSTVVVGGILGLDRLWQAAVMTMVVLPPPFVIPLFMRRPAGPPGDPAVARADAEQEYVMNTLSVATLTTLAACVIVTVAFAN